jgi:hypothetical protein
MQATVQEVQATQVVVLVIAIAIVAFWRPVLKYVFMIVIAVIIAALGYGAIVIWQDMHHHFTG